MNLFRHRAGKIRTRLDALARQLSAVPQLPAVPKVTADRQSSARGSGALARLRPGQIVALPDRLLPSSPAGHHPSRRGTVAAARQLNGAAGTLAASVLADSAVEHYRGNFENRAMFLPLVSSGLSLLASLYGLMDRRRGRHPARYAVSTLAAATGIAGTGFHAYNIGKREGGFSWLNLFYAAPIGAPMALTLAGALGSVAEKLRDTTDDDPAVLGLPPGRVVGAIASLGLVGTVGEAGLLHFRGSFQNPFMVLPVTVPPVASALIGASTLTDDPPPVLRQSTRWWLGLTALLGFAGVGFHIYGVSRAMGGWRNWSQNVLNGPPIPAPPSFTGLALAGLAALRLMRGDAHE